MAGPSAIIQPSFAAGEIAPSLYARTDLAKYQVGLKKCRNFLVHPHGGASNRAGTKYLGEGFYLRGLTPAGAPVLIPFVFSTDQTLLLEFGEGYVRFWEDGAVNTVHTDILEFYAEYNGAPPRLNVWQPVKRSSSTVSGFKALEWYYGVGDVANQVGCWFDKPTEVYRNGVLVTEAADEQSFLALDPETEGPAWFWGERDDESVLVPPGYATLLYCPHPDDYGLMLVTPPLLEIPYPYSVSTPYMAEDLPDLRYTQVGDVVFLTHPNYPVYTLKRYGASDWRLAVERFVPGIDGPEGIIATASSTGSPTRTYSYAVTAVDKDTTEESLAGMPDAGSTALATVDDVTLGFPTVFELTGDGFTGQTGDYVLLDGFAVGGAEEFNGLRAIVTLEDIGISEVEGNRPRGADEMTLTSIGAHNLSIGDKVRVYLNMRIGPSTFFQGKVFNVIDVLNGTHFVVGLNDHVWITGLMDDSSSHVQLVSRVSVDIDSTDFTTHTTGGTLNNFFVGVLSKDLSDPTSPYIDLSWDPVDNASYYNVYRNDGNRFGYIGSADGTSFRDDYYDPDTTRSVRRYSNPFDGPGRWPATSALYEQRLLLAGQPQNPQAIHGSVIGSLTNFGAAFPPQEADAFQFVMASRRVDAVRHLMAGRSLNVLTSGGEFTLRAGEASGTLSPTNVKITDEGSRGAANVPPVVVGDLVIYVQRGGNVVRSLSYSFEKDGITSSELSLLSSHLFKGKTVVSMAYQQSPGSVVWLVLSDGSVASLTLQVEHDVVAWARHDFGDHAVQSVVVLPSDAGDDVYFVFKRPNDTYSLQKLMPWSTTSPWFVDDGAEYDSTDVTTVPGFDHLEGELVSVVADGVVLAQQTVSNGTLTLAKAAGHVIAGRPIQADLETLEPEVPGAGTIQGKTKRYGKVIVRVEDSTRVQVGSEESTLMEKDLTEDGSTPFTGDVEVFVTPDWRSDIGIFIRQDLPLPVTILGVIPDVIVGG